MTNFVDASLRVELPDSLQRPGTALVEGSPAPVRSAGQLDVLGGVIGCGWERLECAPGSARDHGLLYDESGAEHDAVGERLGVVRR